MFEEAHKGKHAHTEGGEDKTRPEGPDAQEQQEAAQTPSDVPHQATQDSPDEQEREPTPEEKLAALAGELEAEKDRRLRALAELQNFRRRSQEARAEQLQYANERLLGDLIPVIDHFEMAAAAAEADEQARAVSEGYDMILQQLKEVVGRYGLSEIEAVEGMFFDPDYHEATERIPTKDPSEGTVIRILRKGYKLHDRVLRPVQVAVAVAPKEMPAHE